MTPQRLETLDDVKQWIAEHDGRIEAWWVAQRESNNKVDMQLSGLRARVTSMEKRMMWIAGFAAAAGSALGSFLTGAIG